MIRMKKKIAALLLAASLLAASFTGCGNTGNSESSTGSASSGSSETAQTDLDKTPDELLHERYEEPVKIKVVLGYSDPQNPDAPDGLTPETTTAVKQLKEKYNIELEYSWVVNSDQYESKFGAELAAGNLPDIMLVSPTQFEDLYSQGGLADLTDAYNLYANDNIKNIVNYDGELINTGMREDKIYGLPRADYPAQSINEIYYDMNKLKQAGIESYDQLPKTITEFEALCDKLMTLDLDGNGKTGDPVLPANKNYAGGSVADLTMAFTAYGSSPSSAWYDDGTGTLVNSVVQPEVKEALTTLNNWYNKGYIAKDFAAQDIWVADSPLVSDIAAGKYAIVAGCWWTPNWPLNEHKKNDPAADWVAGPYLTQNGEKPLVTLNRYALYQFCVASRDCKNPEAIFKMMNWSLEYEKETSNPEWIKNATDEQLLEKNSHVYNWLPYIIYSPTSALQNYEFIAAKDKAGSTTLSEGEDLPNSEFWLAWDSYLKHKDGTEDSASWGFYLSRLAPNGGVGKMQEIFDSSDKRYNEIYITTPSMVTRSGEMGKYQNSTFLSMIMGETPISDFDKFVAEWNRLGGDEISKEVNEWYKNK